jgi:hypothetical protein
VCLRNQALLESQLNYTGHMRFSENPKENKSKLEKHCGLTTNNWNSSQLNAEMKRPRQAQFCHEEKWKVKSASSADADMMWRGFSSRRKEKPWLLSTSTLQLQGKYLVSLWLNLVCVWWILQRFLLGWSTVETIRPIYHELQEPCPHHLTLNEPPNLHTLFVNYDYSKDHFYPVKIRKEKGKLWNILHETNFISFNFSGKSLKKVW